MAVMQQQQRQPTTPRQPQTQPAAPASPSWMQPGANQPAGTANSPWAAGGNYPGQTIDLPFGESFEIPAFDWPQQQQEQQQQQPAAQPTVQPTAQPTSTTPAPVVASPAPPPVWAGENALEREHEVTQQGSSQDHEAGLFNTGMQSNERIQGTYGDRATEDRWQTEQGNAQDRWAQMQRQGHESGMQANQLESDLAIQGAFGERAQHDAMMQQAMQGFQGEQAGLDRGHEMGMFDRQAAHDITTGGSLDDRANLMREFMPAGLELGGAMGGGGGMLDVGTSGTSGDSAAFARAADQQAQMQRGAQRGLSDQLASMGLADTRAGGTEAAMRSDLAGQSSDQLSNVIREQAIQQQGRENQVSDRNLSANLQMRGQQLQQRQQEDAQRNAMLGMVFGSGGRLF